MNRSESDLISLSIQIQMCFLPQISKVVENGEIGQMRPSEYEGAGLPEPLGRMFFLNLRNQFGLVQQKHLNLPFKGGPFSPVPIYHLAGERRNPGHLGSNRHRTTCCSPWIFQIKSTRSNGKPLKFHTCQQSSLVICVDDVEGFM